MKYKICIEEGPNNYSAYSPDVPGCVATGQTRAEVARNLKSAIRFHLAEEIRQFAGDKYIDPLRKKGGGFVEIRADADGSDVAGVEGMSQPSCPFRG